MKKHYALLNCKKAFFMLTFLIQLNVFAQCLTPATPTVGTVTTSTAQINFSSTIATSIIEWGEAGYIPNSNTSYGNPVSSTGYKNVSNVNTLTIEGLEANTTYDLYVRRNCGGGAYSANSAKLTFTTANTCSAVDVPYFEGFSGTALMGGNYRDSYSLPACTRSINNINEPKWRVGGGFSGVDPYLALTGDAYPSTTAFFISRGINLTAGVPYKLDYSSNDPTMAYIISMSVPAIINSNSWTGGSGYIFTPTTSGVYYIGFRSSTAPQGVTVYLDNISLKDNTNPCPKPTAVSAVGISSSQISVSYTSPPGNSCFIEYKREGYAPITVLSASSPYVISGLLPNVRYDIKMRRQCATNSVSDNTPTISVRTLDCSTAPSQITTQFVTSDAAKIDWQSGAAASSYDFYYTTNASIVPDSFTVPIGNLVVPNIFLDGLNSNTTYYYFVRSVCGSFKSNWSPQRQFTTATAANCNRANQMFPETAFTPACTGNLEGICYATTSEVTLVNFLANKEYTFTSTKPTDYVTISNTAGVVYASGQTPLVWSSGANSGVLIYVLHTDSGCGNDYPEFRIKAITCSNTTTNPSCAAPFGLTSNNISTDSAVLNWNAPTTVPSNGYQYYFSSVNTPPTTGTTSSGSSIANTIAINNLSPGTTYYYWVRSNCNGTYSAWISGGNFITLTVQPCGLPTNLAVFNVTNDSAQFSWNAPAPEPSTGYQFYAVTTNVTPSNDISTSGSIITNTFANFNGLLAGTTYYYWVRSVCDTTASVWVSGGSFTTTGTTVCNTPVLPEISNISTNSVTIAWTAPNPIPTNGYQYYYNTNGGVPDENTIPNGSVVGTNVTLAGLSSGTRYYCWIRSNCGNGQSTWRTTGSFLTLSSGCDIPLNVTASNIFSTGASINWTPPTPAPSNGYQYYYSTNFSAPTATTTPSGSSAVAAVLLTGVWSSGTTYYFWVRSNCGTQTSAWSAATTVTTRCSDVIDANDINPTLTSVQLYWSLQYPDAAPANGYDYYVNTSNATPATSVTPTGTTNNTSVTITSGLLPNTQYYYWVRSNCGDGNTNGWGVFDGIFTTTPTNCTPPSADLIVSNITSARADLSWTPTPVAPGRGYQFLYSTSNVAPPDNYDTFANVYSSTTHSLDSLIANTTYYVWVRSVCSLSNASPWIGTSFVTPPFFSCNNGYLGIYDENPFTPACSGNTETMFTNTISGAFAKVNVIANKQYTFSTSRNTDYITITNEAGSVLLANGTSPVLWQSGTYTGQIRYFVNTNSACNSDFNERTIFIKCSDPTVACSVPSSLSVSNILATEISFNWTAPSQIPSSGYQYYVSTSDVTPVATTAATGSANSTNATFNGLTPNTTYYFWVRSNCGATQSDWVAGGTVQTLPTLKISSYDYDTLSAFPNPVTDFLNLLAEKEIASVAVFNLIGQEVVVKTVNSNEAKIDMSGLPAGTYLVKVFSGKMIKTVKVLKK